MIFWRKVIVVVFLAVFLAAFTLSVLGGTKVIPMGDIALIGFFLTILGQLTAALTAVLKTPDFFKEDPLSVERLQKQQADAIADLTAQHQKEKAKQTEDFSTYVAKLQAAHEVDKQEYAQECRRVWEKMYWKGKKEDHE